jgi:hypothetical protein
MTLICPICGRTKSGVPRTQKTCGHHCARKWTRRQRGADYFSQLSQRNYEAKCRANSNRALAIWLERFPNVDARLSRRPPARDEFWLSQGMGGGLR